MGSWLVSGLERRSANPKAMGSIRIRANSFFLRLIITYCHSGCLGLSFSLLARHFSLQVFICHVPLWGAYSTPHDQASKTSSELNPSYTSTAFPGFNLFSRSQHTSLWTFRLVNLQRYACAFWRSWASR